MGIFDRGSDNEKTESLVDQARGDSVTEKRLSSISPGISQSVDSILKDAPSVIEYLEKDEQPHHCFTNGNKGIIRDEVVTDNQARSLMVVTDQRVLLFTDASAGEAIPLDAVIDTEAVGGMMKHRLDIDTENHSYTFYIKNKFDSDEVESCSEYIQSQSNESVVLSKENTKIGDLERPWEQLLASTLSTGQIQGNSINEKIHRARGDSVNKKRLSSIFPGLNLGSTSGADNQSLIQFLEEDEQPHHCFTNKRKGIIRDSITVGDGKMKGHQNIMTITDQRVLFFTKSTAGEGVSLIESSAGEEIPLDAIVDTQEANGRTKHRFDIHTENHKYTFYINRKFSFDEIESAGDYIDSHSNAGTVLSEENTRIGNLKKPWEQSLSEISSLESMLADSQKGEYVTEERVEEVRDILDPDEKVHYITNGGTIDVEGSGAGSSVFGNDRGRKSSLGNLRAVITNRRVAVKIPQMTGDDERSVPYDSITSVDLDTGIANKRLTLQTAGQTYHIQVTEPKKEEVQEITRFIREKRKEANQQEVVVQQSDDSSEPDPLEQIEKLKELKEAGAISEDEFEEKKQDLLDKI